MKNAKSASTPVSQWAIALLVIALFASVAIIGGRGNALMSTSPLPTLSPLDTPVPTLPPSATPTLLPGQPTPTPAPTSIPATPTPPAAGILGYHIVRYGETLFCIGRAYAVVPWAIADQNGLTFPYTVWVGQRLAIPNVPWQSVPAGPVCSRQFGGTQPAQGCRAIHSVYFGDTLYGLSRRYGTTVWGIATANHIANPNLIFVGQNLCIP